MSYLCDEGKQHANHDNGDISLRQLVASRVGLHVAVCYRVLVGMGGGCIGHGVHRDVSSE